MKIDKTHGLKIKLKGKDADNFKSAIEKVIVESKKVGFMKLPFTEDEVKLFGEIKDKL